MIIVEIPKPLSVVYSSPFNKNDIATALNVDVSGNVYISARSESAINNQDFLTLKFNQTGLLEWQTRYDFSGLSDIQIAVEFATNGDVLIAGEVVVVFIIGIMLLFGIILMEIK